MAGKITAMGGSLDVNSIVSQLMNVERAPLAKLQKEQAGINTKLSAWGTVKSALSELQTAAEKLIKQDTWNATTASSSNEDQVQATGGNSKGGATGNHSLVVKQLAQSQTVATRSFANADAVVGGGTLRIQMGTVNNDGNGVRLMLTGSSGAKNAFEISASGNGLDALNVSATAQAGANGSQRTQVARDAKMQLNGLDVSSASNKVTDMIEGVTFNLKKADNAPVNISVETNKESLKEDVENFMKAYNKVNSLIAEQAKYDPATKKAGTLQGNATLVRIQQQVRSLVRAQDDGSGLASAGFELDRNGALSIKDAKLKDLLNNPEKMRTVFAGAQKASGAASAGGAGATSAAGAAAASGAGTGTMSAATAALLSGSAGSGSGVAGMLSARLKEILDDDGSLSGTTKALRRSLDASTSRADRLNEQLERTEERLLKQYAALDKNISNITNSFSSIASLLR